jgi:hypothetical protein
MKEALIRENLSTHAQQTPYGQKHQEHKHELGAE